MTKINEFKTWWAHLNRREQWMLMAGAVLVGLFLFYIILIRPINNSLNTQIENMNTQKELLQWMQTSVPQLQSLRQSNTNRQAIPAGSLLAFVEQSLKESLLSQDISTLEKNPDNTSKESVQLKFDKVSFDYFMKWLIKFWQTYKVNINQISVTRTQAAGVVQVNFVLNLSE
jgi:type II secretory pathway component PulM